MFWASKCIAVLKIDTVTHTEAHRQHGPKLYINQKVLQRLRWCMMMCVQLRQEVSIFWIISGSKRTNSIKPNIVLSRKASNAANQQKVFRSDHSGRCRKLATQKMKAEERWGGGGQEVGDVTMSAGRSCDGWLVP